MEDHWAGDTCAFQAWLFHSSAGWVGPISSALQGPRFLSCSMNSPCSSKSVFILFYVCWAENHLKSWESSRWVGFSSPCPHLTNNKHSLRTTRKYRERGTLVKKTSPGIIFVFCGRGEGWRVPSRGYVSCMLSRNISCIWNPQSPLLLASFLQLSFCSWSRWPGLLCPLAHA